jgi:hypothetical protein
MVNLRIVLLGQDILSFSSLESHLLVGRGAEDPLLSVTSPIQTEGYGVFGVALGERGDGEYQ